MKNKYVIYHGYNCFEQPKHGIKLESGVVYPVSDEVFEYLKAIRNVLEVKKIEKKEIKFKG